MRRCSSIASAAFTLSDRSGFKSSLSGVGKRCTSVPENHCKSCRGNGSLPGNGSLESRIFENNYRQAITAVVQNGRQHGSTVTFKNTYTDSEVKSIPYRVGDSLFAGIQDPGEKEKVSVMSMNRDAWLVELLGLFEAHLKPNPMPPQSLQSKRM